MHRFYLPQPDFLNQEATLSKAESRHAAVVLRLGKGQEVVVFDGRGSEARARIVEAGPKTVKVEIGQRSCSPPLPCEVTLVQALPKGKNMELIVQKAVELGAARICPVISERSVLRLSAEEARKKAAKWQAVALEACKQSGQNFLPEVAVPVPLKEHLESTRLPELPLVASLQPDARHFKHWLAEICPGRVPRSAAILIGPEGDFTPAETALAKSQGYHPVSLGPIILRTETAAIYSLAVLAHECFLPGVGQAATA